MGSPGAEGQGDDYEEIDYKICGELGKCRELLIFRIEEKNMALDEFAMGQNPEGAIQVRV